jgi:hypothetical protein
MYSFKVFCKSFFITLFAVSLVAVLLVGFAAVDSENKQAKGIEQTAPIIWQDNCLTVTFLGQSATVDFNEVEKSIKKLERYKAVVSPDIRVFYNIGDWLYEILKIFL